MSKHRAPTQVALEAETPLYDLIVDELGDPVQMSKDITQGLIEYQQSIDEVTNPVTRIATPRRAPQPVEA